MPLHPQAQAVCDLMNATRVEMAPEDRVRDDAQRVGSLPRDGRAAQPEPVFAVDDHDADGVPVRVYRPVARRRTCRSSSCSTAAGG